MRIMIDHQNFRSFLIFQKSIKPLTSLLVSIPCKESLFFCHDVYHHFLKFSVQNAKTSSQFTSMEILPSIMVQPVVVFKNCFFLVGIVIGLFLSTCSTTDALLLPPAVVHTACGFVAGSAGAIAAYPIDYVKSQLQTEAGRVKYSSGGGLQAAYEIVREDGIFALYRGVMVNIIGIAPEKTIKLSVNDAARLAIASQMGGHLPIVGEVLAGAFAGMTQVIVTNPLEVVKVKLQTSDMTIREVLSEFKSLGDIYQGAEACIARDMIFSGILFPLYAHAKVFLGAFLLATFGGDTMHGSSSSVEFWANMLAGSLAATPAAIIATPPDVVKTRMQQANGIRRSHRGSMTSTTGSIHSADAILHHQKSGQQEVVFADPLLANQQRAKPTRIAALEVLNDIVRDEGVHVLFSGCAERVVRSAPQFGVTLAVFDVLNSLALEHGWILSS